MPTRQFLAAALLAATAIGALAHETADSQIVPIANTATAQPSDGQQEKAVNAATAAAASKAALNCTPAIDRTGSTGLTRAQVRAELVQWRRAHNGDPVGLIY